MDVNTKILRLGSLANQEFKELFIDLLRRVGYNKISSLPTVSPFVSAEIKSGLKSNSEIFYLTSDSLSGSKETDLIDNVSKELVNYSNTNKTYSFFLVSNNYISKGVERKFEASTKGLSLEFQGRDSIIKLIDEHNKDFWKHDDRLLINYENSFIESIETDTDLKKLKIFDEKYDKVLKIFIEPRVYSMGEDTESGKPTRRKINLQGLCEEEDSKVISGEAGAGKSTFLRQIGLTLIDKNRNTSIKRKYVPIFITTLELVEHDYSLDSVLSKHLANIFTEPLEELAEIYKVNILVDSIDELSNEVQAKILRRLLELDNNLGIKYVVGTRNSEQIQDNQEESKSKTYQIDKFNQDQIRKYVENFFPQNKAKAESLLDALRDNRILERLPITPLTLSLVSILYEERDFEIPATIADIYDNFNHLLLGKATVSSRIEFIDISFAQRILSLYAFELLHKENHQPMELSEFTRFFQDYFRNKSSNLGSDKLLEFLNHLTKNSGILELKDGKYIQFKHNSFLEYYAAQEYFKHERNDHRENEIVENFFDPIWQNTAIFYGGMSRDMPDFLTKIIAKVKGAKMFPQYFAGVNGLGYLLQALYQTDNMLRVEGIKQAVETNLEAFELLKKLAHDQQLTFKNYKLPILSLINLTYFYENFNSIALKHPLEICFDDYFNAYVEDPQNSNAGYRALKIALTLNSPRLAELKHLEKLIDETEITSNAYLSLIAHFAISISDNSDLELKKELKKSIKKNPAIVKELQDSSLSKVRFSLLDSIHPEREVLLIVEGQTDVQIIEHAFMVLKDGERPYWNIDYPKHQKGGGARAVADALNGSVSTISPGGKVIIGIFDNDDEGQKNFNGHISSFMLQDDNRIKKTPNAEIYGMKLPIPQRIQHYFNRNQKLNYFELEHYFSLDFLRENATLKETGIPYIFEIGGRKTSFARKVTKVTDKEIFRDFIDLFKLIDKITGKDLDYS
jgi:ABC-type dipeptide/oligopeptide/nickel transport system ATPase component